ncbi:hypothetical protein GGS23DRAFT_145460 [Durotheca rogersii]|uniref:uncharacterized protein n=1 Tax=Durotheca rogersii TaxID=419775 RepID=UPI00221F658A|nr:uncharacterized protein GGS23DRAFT_145460 [Durotheca rogersii]KAI5861305.1 hypothetical protein GGS23DRAFT_145460 [Durotheca rogersii]
MQPLTTVFTPPPGCYNRFVVYIDTNSYHSSVGRISSGFWDRSFSKCAPCQNTKPVLTFSPGVCPQQMSIVSSASISEEDGASTSFWRGWCCQSGFVVWSHGLCTSTATAPFSVLLDPNISTTDLYTTFSTDTWIMHDPVTVEWQEADLKLLPPEIASHYRSIMGITTAAPAALSIAISHPSEESSSTAETAPSTSPFSLGHTTPPVAPTVLAPSTSAPPPAHTFPASTTSSRGSRLSHRAESILISWLAFLFWIHHLQ